MIINGQVEPNALFTFIVDENNSISRIDQYISAFFPHYSRSFFQHLIENQRVSRNGIIVTKAGTCVQHADTISIQFPSERVVETVVMQNHTADVTVVEATQHFMIVYKPPHLLVHPPSKTSTAVTLIDWIKHNYQEITHVGIVDRPGIVHRLDKDTSGIMIITRTNYAHGYFNTLFKERTIQKTYLAVVQGHPDPEGTISLAIGRDPFNRIRMTTFDEESDHAALVKKHSIKIRHAFTEYKVLQYFENAALVEIKPKTGRTHQIRAHMAAIGHPVVGDETYGEASSFINRQALHAYSLSFSFDDIDHSFSKEVPADFQHLLDSLKPLVSE